MVLHRCPVAGFGAFKSITVSRALKACRRNPSGNQSGYMGPIDWLSMFSSNQEVFPIHDELCYEEGRLMLEYIAGNESAAKSWRNIRAG